MSAEPGRFVGLDFGGTAIKGGAVSAAGEVLEERSIPIELERGADDVLDRAAELARGLATPAGPGRTQGIGIGCAGLIDRAGGVLLASPNLAALAGVNLGAELTRRLEPETVHVVLENDANVAALGEQWLGAARGVDDVLVVTLGTGIGGGLVLAGELYTGTAGLAGEIGHVTVAPEGPRCGCGARGCLEALASATAARRRALERNLPAEAPGDLERLAAGARDGRTAETELLFEIGCDLGRGLSYPVMLLDLQCFVFGGGFSAAFDVLEPGVRAGLAERHFGERAVQLRRATLGGSAGWIGAARLVVGAMR